MLLISELSLQALRFFFIHYILIVFSLLQLLADPPYLLTHPTSCLLSLPLSPLLSFSQNKNKCSPKQKPKAKINKTAQWHKNSNKEISKTTPKTSWNLLCVGHRLLVMESALECGLYDQWHPIRENQLSFCQQISITNSFLVRGGTCPLPPLSAGILSGWKLCRPSSCCHSLCEFHVHQSHCAWKTTSLESPLPLSLPVVQPPLLLRLLSLDGRVRKISHLGLSVPKARSLHIVQLWISVLLPIYFKEKLLR